MPVCTLFALAHRFVLLSELELPFVLSECSRVFCKCAYSMYGVGPFFLSCTGAHLGCTSSSGQLPIREAPLLAADAALCYWGLVVCLAVDGRRFV